MNILYVTLSSIPHMGGKSRVMLSEAKAFAVHHKVHVICARPGEDLGADNQVENISVTYIDSSRPASLLSRALTPIRMACVIRRLTETFRVDVVSAQDLYGAIAAILAGKRKTCLLTLHSICSRDPFTMEEPVEGLTPRGKLILGIRFIIDSLIEVLCYNVVRGIISVSEYEQEDAKRKTLCKNKIRLIRNGIDANVTATGKRKELRENLHVRQNEVMFLFLGRMVPKNGPFIITQAIPIVVARHPYSRFIFVGEGTERLRCEHYTRAAKVTDVVHFLGKRDSADVVPAADVFVSHVSSLVRGIGLSVLEALANGLPSIVGKDQITSKILKCGEEIACVKKDDPQALAECMIALAKDDAKRRALSVAGRERVITDFSLQNRISKIEETYQLITSQNSLKRHTRFGS